MYDGVQLEQAKVTVCSEISRASCKCEERQLELGVLAGELWARRRSARRRGSGKRRSYQGVQDIEARLVARSASSRGTGVLGISHRSSCPRQRDPVEGGRRSLEKKEGRNLVRGMRQNMVKKMG
jgi:hypothetical protein